MFAYRDAVKSVGVCFRDLPFHLGRTARSTAIDFRLVKPKNLVTTLLGPHPGIAYWLAVSHHKWIGKRVSADLCFIVIRDMAGWRAAQRITIGVRAWERGSRVGE